MSDIELQRLRMEVVRLTRERDEARRLARRLDQSLEVVLQNSTHDDLTGMLGRRAGTASFHVELGRGLREQSPTSLLVLDLDNFKQVNDQMGHDRGDALLARVAQQILNVVREYDVAIRWGGDEFCVVLPNTDHARAETVGRKLLRAIRQTPFESPVLLTASCGVAGSDEQSIDELIADIDLAGGRIRWLNGENYTRADVFETAVSRLQRYLFKMADLRCYCAKHRHGSNTRITAYQCQGCLQSDKKCVQIEERDKIRNFFWREDGSKWVPQRDACAQA